MTHLSRTANAILHYVDQPHVVKALQQASWPLGLAAAGTMAAKQVNQVDNPGQETIKQAAVIGASLVGTALATHHLNFSQLPALQTLSKDTFNAVSQHLGQDVAQLAQKPQKSLGDFKTLINTLENNAKPLAQNLKTQLKAAILRPPALEADPMHEVKTFMKLGAASVGSGLAGGVAADAINGQPSQLPAKLKEGLFQLGVNIGMCGAGAAAGIATAEKLGHAASRVKRTAWIGTGLAAGIAGGNLVSNLLEKNVVDPLAKATGNTALVAEPARQVHGRDMAMHVDDLPLMLMFAGVEAVKPVIPLCFLTSGINTGLAASPPVKPDAAHIIKQTFSGQHPAFQPFTTAL